jgi:4'-phosphopantetheinyl transferase
MTGDFVDEFETADAMHEENVIFAVRRLLARLQDPELWKGALVVSHLEELKQEVRQLPGRVLRARRASLSGQGDMPSETRIAVGSAALATVAETLWPRLAALLSDEERARAARFHFERNRREYVAAHALKRLMLSEAAGGRPHDWCFAAEPGGKPFVAGRTGLHFNLSHCNGLVACAVSADVPLGVDVEPLERRAPLDVADHYFAPDERAWLFGLPDGEQSRGFFRLWTMKEAFIKATGKGVAQGLHSFAIGFEPLRVTFPDPGRAEPGEWRFVQEAIGGGHLLGLAWRGPDAAVTLRAIRLEDMLGG